MLKKVAVFHIIPFLLACLIFFITYNVFISKIIDNKIQTEALQPKIITGKQTKLIGRYAELTNGDSLELNYIASIKNKKQITLFGSSEFSESPYVTYNFLPKNKNYQMMGLGHAHHQSLSILIELLAAHKENKGSKVVIFISPGWFEVNGSNTEAFAEFARPNFLNRIATDTSIDLKYKKYIGEFIDLHFNEFEGVSQSMKYFRKIYLNSQVNQKISSQFKEFIRNSFSGTDSISSIQKVDYQPKLTYTTPLSSINTNYDSISHQLQSEFINNIVSNKIYVNDAYYNKYLVQDNGDERFVILENPNLPTNYEYNDFKYLIDYVSERQMEASFIIIPLNPYYYRNTEIYLPLIDSITTMLDKNNLPYQNLFVTDTANYEPATLKDVMHFGDYGWMKVNKYIDSLYYGNY